MALHTPASSQLIVALGYDPENISDVVLQITEGQDPKIRLHAKVISVVEVRDVLEELDITKKETL